MSTPFKTLLDKMPPERRRRIKIMALFLKHEMALQELRQAIERSLSSMRKSKT